jgi:hypothetical protein
MRIGGFVLHPRICGGFESGLVLRRRDEMVRDGSRRRVPDRDEFWKTGHLGTFWDIEPGRCEGRGRRRRGIMGDTERRNRRA